MIINPDIGKFLHDFKNYQAMQNLEAFEFQIGYAIKRAIMHGQPSVSEYALANNMYIYKTEPYFSHPVCKEIYQPPYKGSLLSFPRHNSLSSLLHSLTMLVLYYIILQC